MGEILDALSDIPLFAELDGDSRSLLASSGETRELSTGELLYTEGDASDGIFVILEGSVELLTGVEEGMERVFGTLGSGRIVGMLALLDEGVREATARAVEESRVLYIRRELFRELRRNDPLQWAGILADLAGEMASQTRFLIDQYRQALAWNLEISGASTISLDRLVEQSMETTIELIDGTSLRGRVLNVNRDAAGWDLLFRADDGSLRIVPRHALLQIMALPGGDPLKGR